MAQPLNVRIVSNDSEARAGTTKAAEAVLRLSSVTLTQDDLDRLAAAIAERLGASPTVPPAAAPDDYVTVRRNTEQRPMSEY